jgi:DNA repair exonuclease SbcCD ATPase subunit
VEARGKRSDDYIEQQLQGNLDYMNDRLQELKDTILDVQVLQDQTLSDQDELRAALEGRLSASEQHIQVLRDTAETLGQSVSAVGEIVPRVVGELKSRLSSAEDAWSERFRSLEDGVSQAASGSADAEHARESLAEIREQLGGLTERVALQEDNTVESSAQLKTHIGLIDELHTSLGQCQTILEGQEERLNDLSEDLDNQRTALQETAEALSHQVRGASDSFEEQCRLLQEDIHTLKQDLTSHAGFTNDSLGDLQEALQQEITAVKESAQEAAAKTDALQAELAELRTATAEVSELTQFQKHLTWLTHLLCSLW